jgi:hypothetical protein
MPWKDQNRMFLIIFASVAIIDAVVGYGKITEDADYQRGAHYFAVSAVLAVGFFLTLLKWVDFNAAPQHGVMTIVGFILMIIGLAIGRQNLYVGYAVSAAGGVFLAKKLWEARVRREG